MTNDEINRYIHTEIMGSECCHTEDKSTWVATALHDRRRIPPMDMPRICLYCGASDVSFDVRGTMDYCSDSSPRLLLHEVVAEVLSQRGRDTYDDALEAVLKPDVWAKNRKRATSPAGVKLLASALAEQIVLASINPTAEQIARACVGAHKETANA